MLFRQGIAFGDSLLQFRGQLPGTFGFLIPVTRERLDPLLGFAEFVGKRLGGAVKLLGEGRDMPALFFQGRCELLLGAHRVVEFAGLCGQARFRIAQFS